MGSQSRAHVEDDAGAPGRMLSSLLSVALVLPGVMVLGVVAAPPAAAAAQLTLTKTSPATVLAGGEADVHVDGEESG